MNHEADRVARENPLSAASRYARSIYLLFANRRKFERVAISGTIRVTLHGYDIGGSDNCICVDISPGGMAIECLEPMAPGVIIDLYAREHDTSRLARVCYCQQRDRVFRMGLEFIAESGQAS
jgi:hypothetical protein